VGELAEPFRMSLPAVSKHLRVLERAGLLRREKDGRVRRCTLNPGPMENAAEWLSFYRGFWEGQLDSLAAFLEKPAEDPDG
jgi:DNA-binding transcriptional ArsR family regulator